MNKLSIIFSLFLILALCQSLNVQDLKDWSDFKAKYNKQYYSSDEESIRLSIFVGQKNLVKEHNIKYQSHEYTYFLGINQYSDLTLDEYKESFFSYNDEPCWLGSNDVLPVPQSSFPTSFDWRTKGAVTPIKDQGTCGSCYTFSSVGALEALNVIQGNKLINLSEQQVVDCSQSYSNFGCRGGMVCEVFNYTSVVGITTDDKYPYIDGDQNCTYTPSEKVFQNKWMELAGHNSESSILSRVAQQPVSIATDITDKWRNYAGGIFNDPACTDNQAHAVLIVGYAEDYVIVKNSMGTSWGEKGYIRYARTGDGPGMCGIYQNPWYPTY